MPPSLSSRLATSFEITKNDYIEKLLSLQVAKLVLDQIDSRNLATVDEMKWLLQNPKKNVNAISQLLYPMKEQIRLLSSMTLIKFLDSAIKEITDDDIYGSPTWMYLVNDIIKLFPKIQFEFERIAAYFTMKLWSNNIMVDSDVETAFVTAYILKDYQLAYDILEGEIGNMPRAVKSMITDWVR